MEGDAGVRGEGNRPRRCAAGSAQSRQEGANLLCQGYRLQEISSDKRACLCIRTCCQRGECIWRSDSYGSHLWSQRSRPGRSLSSLQGTRIHGQEDSSCNGYRRYHWKCSEAECFHFGCRCGLPGRGGCRLCHGCCSGLPALRRKSFTDRVFCRDGIGTSSGHDLRSCMRAGSDSMHREKCLCSYQGPGCQSLCGVLGRKAPRLVRQGR